MRREMTADELKTVTDMMERAETRAESLTQIANFILGIVVVGVVLIVAGGFGSAGDDTSDLPFIVGYAITSLVMGVAIRAVMVAVASGLELRAQQLRFAVIDYNDRSAS